MAGQIKVMIDQIIENRSKGNALLVSTTQTKLILKASIRRSTTRARPTIQR